MKQGKAMKRSKGRRQRRPKGQGLSIEAALGQGRQYQAAGRIGEAESIYRQVLATVPGHPEALFLLASVARRIGRHESALQLLDSALVAAPENPNYYLARGVSLEALLRWQEALADYQRVIDLCPQAAEAYNNMGNVLHARGDLDAAVRAFRQALVLKPDYLEARIHLGHALKMTGDLDAAAKAYHRVLSEAPERVEIYRSLAGMKRFEDETDPELQAMRRLSRSADMDPGRAAQLHFALGKACHDLHETDDAFAHWQTANRLQRAGYDYRIDDDVELVRSIKAAFDGIVRSGWPAPDQSPAGDAGARPIFIVGMPRSGTSLTEQILASHPQVGGAGEVGVLRAVIEGPGAFPAVVGCDDKTLRKMARTYYERMAFFNLEQRPRLTDKTLFNFFYIGMIRLLFPRAAVICCWRDPMDTGLSCYRQYFPDIRRFVDDLYEIGRFYGIFADMMAYWRECLPGFVLDLCYEDLVADQQRETRRLLEFCGLPWDDACLDFHLNQRAVKTLSTTQVRRPLYRTGVAQWQAYEGHLDELRRGLSEQPLSLPASLASR